MQLNSSKWQQTELQALTPEEVATDFKAPVVATIEWVLRILDEAERVRRLPRTKFDMPVRDKLKKAS